MPYYNNCPKCNKIKFSKSKLCLNCSIKERNGIPKHDKRLVVGASFIGWERMFDLYEKCLTPRDRLLMLCLFKTGGRINEVLTLSKNNFDLITSENSIIVKDMKVSKKFISSEKKSISVDVRRTIPILKKEFLSDDLIKDLKLFNDINCFGFTRIRAYQILSDLGERTGIRISSHWFRGQRASQLAEEYDFDVFELNKFFGWGSRNPRSSAERYASLGWRGLENRMLDGVIRLRGHSL